MNLSQSYLIFYNGFQSISWFIIFVWSLWVTVSQGSLSQVYGQVGQLSEIIQLLSLMETLHAILGLVKSGFGVAFLQWIGRWNVIYFVVHNTEEVQSSWAAGLLILSWSLAEVCRYPWYFLNLCGKQSQMMTFLRYTAFIPLYPLGTMSEMVLVYYALEFIQKSKLYTVELPNNWNFAFDYALFLKMLLVVYLVPFLYLYTYMLKSRNKRLGGKKDV
eukprot:TRINITY_DN2352_c0_g2_i1.p1 TRINITY_DN2352_c0_g2~~TRINITY_DN2352_c0_g2_i1.p1  ORF type:complete len:217 (-),score=6.92 TRINITY_DN2352_c0_g2_i1:277-927(-)